MINEYEDNVDDEFSENNYVDEEYEVKLNDFTNHSSK